MSTRYKINQFNWLSQKLLAQNQYVDIIELHQSVKHKGCSTSKPISNHLRYVHGVATIQLGLPLDELIIDLQRFNFYKNIQHFLLLCKSLLCLGNHESVVALCQQIVNKNIDFLGGVNDDYDANSSDKRSELSQVSGELVSHLSGRTGEDSWCLGPIDYESVEFKQILSKVKRSNFLSDPKFWLIFGVSLEYRRRFKDADLVYRIACKLSLPDRHNPTNSQDLNTRSNHRRTTPIDYVRPTDFYVPSLTYAKFRIRHRGDLKSARNILDEAIKLNSQNYELNCLLAMSIYHLEQSSDTMTLASRILSSLESVTNTRRNPSNLYNLLAFRCKRLSGHLNYSEDVTFNLSGEGSRFSVDYLLTQSFLIINNIIQNSTSSNDLFECPTVRGEQQTESKDGQLDTLIHLLRSSDSSCWNSASVWNNLGLSYLLKGRLIASVSCLEKAYQLNPIDWRINYNMAIVNLHLQLHARALTNLLSSRRFSSRQVSSSQEVSLSVHPIVNTYFAICLDKLQSFDLARQFFIESSKMSKNKSYGSPVASLVNYLIFLDNNMNRDDPQGIKLKSRILDKLEQVWLQRDPNDPQFNVVLMEVATRIGHLINSHKIPSMRKTYAWTKS